MTDDGARVIVPDVGKFFAAIVHDEASRQAGDFCYLARLHEWMQEFEDAEAVLIEAQSLYPRYWEIPFQRAAFRDRAKDHQGALFSAEQATEFAPWKRQTWWLLGEIHDRLGNTGQAAIAKKRSDEIQQVRDQLAAEIDLL